MKKSLAVTVDLAPLFGVDDKHLVILQKGWNLQIAPYANGVEIVGSPKRVRRAIQLIQEYEKISVSGELADYDFGAMLPMIVSDPALTLALLMKSAVASGHRGKAGRTRVMPKNEAQRLYMEEIAGHDITLGVGPAGTGKTYLAVAMAVSALLNKQVKRLILIRPAVEAGEKLGFLPGSLQEKIDPYLRPLYDAMFDMLSPEAIRGMIEKGIIEVAPLAFMRGRTLKDAFIIVDEAQNCTIEQMKMIVTRMGEGSKMIVNGDLTQIDLPKHLTSGLEDALDVLDPVEEIGIFEFDKGDVVRHSLVQKIVEAYENQ